MTNDKPVVLWRKARAAAGARPPLLVLLHGRGADERDLFELAPAIDDRIALAALRAPLPTEEGGYTWSQSRSPGRYDRASLRSTLEWFDGWLDTVAGARAQPQDVYLFGFSAGMAMAAALLLDAPQRYAGAVLLSGTLPFETDVPTVAGRLANVAVFYGHGSFDRVIPADLVARSDKFLRDDSGAALIARRYPIAHEIGADEMREINECLVRWITRA